MKRLLRIPQNFIFIRLLSAALCVHTVSAFAQGYSVTSFSQEWCSVSTFPTSFIPVSAFSINETQTDGFRKNQTSATLILNLPSGFEFNTAAGTVTFPAGRDISSLIVSAYTTTSITLTITIPNAGGDNALDTIYFNNFEVRATASASGNFLRNGGTFLINNSTANPTSTQPLGILSSDQQQMVYVSSQALNKDSSDILLNCGTDKQILEIAITVSGACGALTITLFDFSSNGDAGYSQNPLINISDAKVFYTGVSRMTSGQVFSPVDLFGSLGAAPSGSFTITGNRKLNSATGTHYFYLTYNVPPTANAGDKLDASLTSLLLDGITQTPSVTNPVGTRTISATPCFTPDLPSPLANSQTVTAGSLVIPMDNANQALNAPFNLKAYGLIHKLLLNDIPVKWVIKSGKVKDAIDFSAMSERVYPSFVAAAMIDYRASAFIIDSIYINQSFNSFGTTADQIISGYGNNVAVFRLVNDETVDVRYTLDQRPKIAVFNNGGNQPIHMKMLDTAGVTNYVAISAGVFEGLPACYTFCSEPHWAATINDSSITQKVWDFVYSGGNFFAQCRGVEAYENNERFHTDNNIGILNTTVSNTYHNPDLAFMQYEGIVVSNQGGSERNWVRAVASNWRSGFYRSISDTDADTIVASGAHLVNSEQRGGNVFYLGGHDYFAGGAADWTNIQQLNAARMYLNATLVPASRPTAFTLDLGGSQSTCQGIGIPLGGNPTGPSGATYTWTPSSGLNNPNSSNPIATPLQTTTYTVFADNNGCPGYGTVTITVDSAPQSDAGIDQTVCANNASVNLNGSVIYATGGVWSSNGNGNFSPGDTLLNATYTAGSADTTAGTVTLVLTSSGNPSNCSSTIDSLQVFFSPAPSAFAGVDTTVCSTLTNVNLNGNVTIATGGVWSSTNGTGTFSDSSLLNTNYTLTGADTTAGSIEIILTSTGNGNCSPVSDTMNIIIAPDITSVNAGNDTTICANAAAITLSGQVFGSAGGTWSTSGNGSFSPSPDSLNVQYMPGNNDTTAGNVSLILTTTGSSGCITKTDTLLLNFYPSVQATSGNDTVMCASDSSLAVSGSVIQATGGVWSSSGNGTFSPDDSSLNATYTPGTNDYLAGTATLTLTTYGGCANVSDDFILNIIPAVNAGADQNICPNDTDATLAGTTSGNASVIWTTTGTGSFSPGDTILNPDYILSSADSTAGSVALVLSVSPASACANGSDTIALILLPLPVVTAGNDTVMCASDSSLAVSGTVQQVSGGVWSASGNGTFSPNDSSLTVTYFPGTADYLAGTTTLTLTSYGGCINSSDTLILSIVPYANAGADQSICANDTAALLTGTTSAGISVVWTTTGTGTFSPGDTILNPTYTLSPADSAAGSVELVLSVSGATYGCANATDTTALIILPLPVVTAGNDTAICGNDSLLALSGSVQQVSGGTWSTSGNGTFSPNDSTLNATYFPGSADYLSGAATLTLTSNGGCLTIADALDLTIVPFANAGADQYLCTSDTGATLTGNATGGASFIWTASGTGSFSPSDTVLSTTYLITSADSAAGSIALTLSVSGANFGCPNTSDTITIYILPPPVATAGANQTVCANNINIPLSGTITGALGGIWSTDGDGSFLPDSTDLSATYSPGSNDITNGTLTITLTTTGSCVVASDVMNVNITPSPTSNAGADTSVCSTIPDVTLNGFVTVASGGVWSSSGTGTFSPDSVTPNATYFPSNSDTATGNVQLIFTTTGNGNCVAASDSMNIIITPDLSSVNAGNDTSVCAAQISLNGMVSVASGGIWSASGSGNFTPSDSVLNPDYIFSNADTASGTILLILTSTGNGGCLAKSDTVVIGIIDALSINASADDSVCANGGAIPLNAYVSTGSGTWTTSGNGTFSPDNATLNASYLPGSNDTSSGNVTLALTSSNNGACNAITDTLNIALIPAPNAGFNASDVCNFQPVSFIDSSSGNISSWNWNMGDGSSATLTNLSYTYASDGIYTVMLTVVSNNGCTDSIAKTVTVHPLPITDFSVTGQCFIDSVYFYDWSGISSGNIASWNWNFGDGTSDTLTNPSHFYSNAGTYSITLTVTSGFGCSDSLTNSFSIQPSPLAGFGNTTSCTNQTTFFFDSTAIAPPANVVSWNWNFGDGGSDTLTNPSHTYLTADTFNVELIVVSDSGCADTIAQQAIVFAAPSAAFTSTAQCFVDSVFFTDNSTLSSGNIAQWSWNFGDGDSATLTNPSHFYDSAGIYNITLTVASANGCTDTISQTLTVNPAPFASFENNAVCLNDTTLFSDSSTIIFGNIVSWNWNFGDGDSAAFTNPSHVYLTADTFDVKLTVVSNSGCTDDTIVQVIVYPLPVAYFISTAQCFVDSAQFTDSSYAGAGSIISWNWDFGDGTSSTQQNPLHFYPLGNYTVNLTVTSSFGCTDTVTQSLAAAPAPTASFIMSTNTVCINQSILFASTSAVPSPSTITSTNWNFGDGTSSTSPTVFHSFTASDTFTIVLTVTTNSGCIDDTSLQVVAYPSPVADFSANKFCINEPAQFSDSSVASPDTVVAWQWYFGDNGVGFAQNPTHAYNATGSYGVSLIATTNHGCKDTTEQVITINPAPVADFKPDKYIAYTDESFNFINNSAGGILWFWDFGDSAGTSTVQNPSYLYPEGGTFHVLLIAENNFGCRDTATDSVLVNIPPKVPNGFSPNGDGKNDELFPMGGPYKELEFKIFNNWGELIFTSRNASDGWNGTKAGTPQPMGVYVYTLHAITEDGNEYHLHGDVTLLR